MFFAFAFGMDEDIIEVHYHKNIELFYQDLVDIALERGQCVDQSKRYHLILEIAIIGPEGRLLFIAFPDPHLMTDISQIKLGKMLSPI